MTVYVLTSGSYSDYHIEAVTLDRKTAEAYAETANRALRMYEDPVEIEEFDTDFIGQVLTSDRKYYKAYKDSDGHIKVAWMRDADEYFKSHINSVEHLLYVNALIVNIYAKDKDHAFKVAADLFAQYEAEHAGISLYKAQKNWRPTNDQP